MANNDKPNTGGSQFFVNVADNAMLNFWDDSEAESKVRSCSPCVLPDWC